MFFQYVSTMNDSLNSLCQSIAFATKSKYHRDNNSKNCDRNSNNCFELGHLLTMWHWGALYKDLLEKYKMMEAIEDDCKDENCILDLGTSNHMMSNLENLFNTQEYSCNHYITIGNGLGLPISHIGIASINSDSGSIPFKNTLLVCFRSKNDFDINSSHF